MIRTRFAPSPTGFIHLGNIRSALFPWAFARRHGGTFILRIEDTDTERSTPEATQAIIDAMAWLGLDYDEGPYFQMQRMDRYRAVIDDMLARGLAYLDYTTPEELDTLREAQQARGEKPRYDGRWRPERAKGMTPPPGVEPAVRFRNPDEGSVVWDDAVKGRIEIANAELDDLVIARSDGTPTYNFCVVVDDVEMRITHVIRGDDHVNNTPRQINIMRALGAPLPVYGHLPTVLTPEGEKLSKRHGARSVLQYRDDGYLADAVVNYLARLGWSHGDDEIFTREQLVQWFELAGAVVIAWPVRSREAPLGQSASTSSARLPRSLARRSRRSSRKRDSIRRQARRPRKSLSCCATARPRWSKWPRRRAISTRRCNPIRRWWRSTSTKPSRPALREILDAMDSHAWTREAIASLLKSTAAKHGLKAPQVMMALRVLVAGTTQTPAIDAVLALLGRDRARERIAAGLGR